MKKGVGSGVGSGAGSISQRYGSGDPEPHQNVTDPQNLYPGITFKKVILPNSSTLQVSTTFFESNL